MLQDLQIDCDADTAAISETLRGVVDEHTAFIFLSWSMPDSLTERVLEVLRGDARYKGVPVLIGDPSDAGALGTAAWLVLDAGLGRHRAAPHNTVVVGAA